MSILDDVQAERKRQIAKGWTPEHDAEHGVDHLVRWAGTYANRSARRDLVKAAALLVAAIEVLDREPFRPLVHAHGPNEGRGLDCGERFVSGRLLGWCQANPESNEPPTIIEEGEDA